MLRTPKPPVNGWVGYPLGFVAAIAVTIVTVAAHATVHPLWSVGALTVTAAAVAAVTTLPAALATAAVCWMLHAGFVLGRSGDLQLSTASAAVAALLATVTVAAYSAGVAVRVGTRWRHRADYRTAAIPDPRSPVAPQLSGSNDGSALA